MNDNSNKKFSMHEKQKEQYSKQNLGTPIGLLKFNEKTSELNDGSIYFANIKNFLNQGREKIQDKEEGFLFTLDNEKVFYKEIIELSQEYAQGYLTSFTVLFENDFDSNGTLKRETHEKILNINGLEGNEETRDAVIFSLKKNTNFMDIIYKMRNNTPEFHNPYLKKKTFDKERRQYYCTNNILDWMDYCFKKFSNKEAVEIIEAIKNPNKINNTIEEKLKKVGVLEDKNVVKIGFKGSYVYYNSDSDLEYNKINLESKLSRNSVEDNNSFLIDCLEYCFLQKNGNYEDQHEYRILIVQYSEQNVFPEGIKLNYPTNDSNWESKIIKNSDIHKLNINEF